MTHLKQQKITWFLLVLHWAMDVIYDFYYINGVTVFRNNKTEHRYKQTS